MPTTLTLTCAATGKTIRIRQPDDTGLTYEPVDGDATPAGWGGVEVRQVVHNPEYAKTITRRAREQLMFDATPDAELNGLRDEVAVAFAATLDDMHPFPPMMVWAVRRWSPLSPDALAAFHFAAFAAGFPKIEE